MNDAATALGLGKATGQRAFDDLQSKGLIARQTSGKGEGQTPTAELRALPGLGGQGMGCLPRSRCGRRCIARQGALELDARWLVIRCRRNSSGGDRVHAYRLVKSLRILTLDRR